MMGVAFARPAAGQSATSVSALVVPAAFDVAGVHVVLDDAARRLVQQKADGLRRHQPSFQARVNLADAAFPIIDRVLKEEGVPLDFRYLVLQESALLGDAQSVHEAVGYWQLKREAASDLGLVVNDQVDERKHLTASTRAAARYLARNNASLHNWLNALLSYNLGLTGVKPYTLPTDFDAREMTITEATSPYVLMFLAQKLAFEPACGLNPKPPLRLQEFPAQPGQTLESQARLVHAEPANLAMHNRWLLAATVPTDKPYTLIVPVGDVTQATGILANQRLQSSPQLITMPAVAANSAEVRLNDLRAIIALPGETTADLARRGGKRLGEFLKHNELTAFDAAVVGRPYYLESKRDVGAVEYHVVQPSETIFDVAQKYGMRQKAVRNKNRLSRVDELRPGRLLWLQHTRPRDVAVEYRTLTESVALESVPPSRSSSGGAAVAKSGSVEEGWGEALATATMAAATPAVAPAAPAPVATPAPQPAPAATPVAGTTPSPAPATERPAAPAPQTAALPPPAAAPAPAPLADEPRNEPAPEPASEPALAAEPAVAQHAPVAAPEPTPTVTTVPLPAPVASAPAPVPASAPAAVPTTTAATGAKTHRVAPKETVYSISRLYQIPPATLMAINNLTPPANLLVGQVLQLEAKGWAQPAPAAAAPVYIPAVPAPAAADAAGTTIRHTVAKGETLYSIARLYKVTVADLQAWNGKLDQTAKLGEVLQVRQAAK